MSPITILNDFVIPVIVMAAISVIYFMSDKSSRVTIRLVFSAHGLLGAVLFCGAILIGQTGRCSRSLELPYGCLFVLPVISILLSFWFFRGNKLVHLLQILNLPCLFWALFIGYMAIGNDWPVF